MNGWDNMFHITHNTKFFYVPQHPLGDDGLIALKSPVQERMNQIEEEYQVSDDDIDTLFSLYLLQFFEIIWDSY